MRMWEYGIIMFNLLMHKHLLFLAIMFLLIGCNPTVYPLKKPPTEDVLTGIWILKDSPSGPLGGQQLPRPKDVYCHFKKGGRADVRGLLVEERIIVQNKSPALRWLLKSSEGNWIIDSFPGNDKTIIWRIVISFDLWQESILTIYENNAGKLELHYSPDPEMAKPFVFVREDINNSSGNRQR